MKKIVKNFAFASILALSTPLIITSCTSNTQTEEPTEAEKLNEANEEFLKDRNDFRSELNDRIEELDRDILGMEKDANDEAEDANEIKSNKYAEIKTQMEAERSYLQNIANDLDSKKKENWDSFKESTRNDWENSKENFKELRKNADDIETNDNELNDNKKMNK